MSAGKRRTEHSSSERKYWDDEETKKAGKMGVKVAKFGGSSVADAIQIKKIKDIIAADSQRCYIVVSAPGKRFKDDSKITDLLYSCMMHREHNLPFEQLFQVINDRYAALAMGLKLKGSEIAELQEELKKIKSALQQGTGEDYIVSRGEYLNAKIIAYYLGYDFVDATELICFDDNGKLLENKTDDKISKRLGKHKNAVIPGFYGARPDGEVQTFSRGGSDITGALVAKGVEAEIYENWTDVSGFLMADPRIVDNPKPIKMISYKELRELSYMGASVLHEDAVYPARAKNIPINIRNTNDKDDEGTIIVNEPDADRQRVITGIAGSKDFTVIAIYKNQLATEKGFVRRIAGILEDYDVSLEHMPSGIDTLSIVVSKKSLNGKLAEILDDIERRLKPDSVEIVEDVALIAIVGCGMSYRTGVSARLFTALADEDINIRMIDQGSSEMNIIVGVEDKDFEKAVRAIYKAFVD